MVRHRTLAWPKLVCINLCIALVILTAFRLIFVTWHYERVLASNGFWFILRQGVRFDLLTLGILFVFPFALIPILLSIFSKIKHLILNLLKGYVIFVWTFLFAMELLSLPFIKKHDIRPNYVFLEYISAPSETLLPAIKLHPFMFVISIVLCVLILSVVLSVSWRFLNRKFMQASWLIVFKPKPAISVSILTVLIGFIMIRSTFIQAPIKPADAAFSNDVLINSLALNSTYTVSHALFEKESTVIMPDKE